MPLGIARALLVSLAVGGAAVGEDVADQAEPKRAPPAPAADPAAPDDDRLAVWNSAEMLAARAWLAEYFRVSGEYSPADAAAYRAGLARLDAEGLRAWLDQIEQTRSRIERQFRDSETDRRYRLARAGAIQQQRAMNLEKLQTTRAARARLAQSQLDAQQRFSQTLFLNRSASRDATLRTRLGNQNLRTLLILNLLDQQELRADLRARGF